MIAIYKKDQIISQNPFSEEQSKCPIILIHGYCGCTQDENWFLDGYFHYAYAMAGDGPLFEADVSVAGSAHDRSCELWQQIVGINKVEKLAK